jgi:23S rRNA (adenine2503-C2)-methyltransferase
LNEFDRDSLQIALASDGLSPSHAPKLLRAFYRGAGRIDFADLNLGPRVEQWAALQCEFRPGEISTRIQSADGTIKLLITFRDGGSAESVLMPGYRRDRAACCVSSQIGCAMGCDFCASTKGGFERNLTSAEIVEQFLYLKAEAMQLGRRLTSVVFMGMGEPMHNLDNVIAAIKRIADPNMGGLGWRQVTVSTVGIVPGIDRLALEDLNVHLALSLHAPDDETRARLVPANRRYPIPEIITAAKRFADKTGRIPTIKYCLLVDVNESDENT